MKLNIKILNDYRTLKKDEEFTFTNKVNFIVGSNGSGKSSLLNLLRSNWKGHYMGRVSDTECNLNIKVDGLDYFDNTYDFNTETDGLKGQSFADMDYLLKNNGLMAMRHSTGEVQNVQLMQLFSEAGKYKDKKVLIVLDEPEKGLDIQNQAGLIKFISTTSKYFNFNYIVATHSILLLQMLDGAVLDLDTRKIYNGEEFVKQQIDKILDNADVYN